jgi:hypothetical protein
MMKGGRRSSSALERWIRVGFALPQAAMSAAALIR